MPSTYGGKPRSNRCNALCLLRAALPAASCWSLTPERDLRAQGVTTAAIRGTVRAADGTSLDGARVSVLNTATGFTAAGHRQLRIRPHHGNAGYVFRAQRIRSLYTPGASTAPNPRPDVVLRPHGRVAWRRRGIRGVVAASPTLAL